jgi:hypothetical protein
MKNKLAISVFSILIITLFGLTGCFNITVQPPTTSTTPAAPGGPVVPPITTPTPPSPPPPPPVINVFSAIPGSIAFGGSSKLTWDVSDATAVSINPGVGTVAGSGNTTVFPGTTTDFILTATNATGAVSASTQVAVFTIIGLPVINHFTASPPSLIVGSSTLSWNISNASAISITPGIGPVGSAGTTSVSPAATTHYTLTASNPAGTVFQTIQVTRIILKPLPLLPILPIEPIPKPIDPIIPIFPKPLVPVIPKF